MRNSNKKTDHINFLTGQAAVFTAVLTLLFMDALPACAETMGSAHISSIFEILKDITNLYIKIAYGLMILVFAAGTVKSGLGAQASQTLNLPKRFQMKLPISPWALLCLSLESFPTQLRRRSSAR